MSHNSVNTKVVNIFEAFAGIGAQRKALENIAKNKHWLIRSVGIVEWYIDAIVGYELLFNKTIKTNIKEAILARPFVLSLNSKDPISNNSLKKMQSSFSCINYLINQSHQYHNNYFDIKSLSGGKIENLSIDIFTYSFPCQDLSNQGKQRGMVKNSDTRSSLLWEVERILTEFSKAKLPKYLLLENVKSIINHKNKPELDKWIQRLNKLGYESKIYCLNAKNFNCAQNRQRVYVVSILKSHKIKTQFEFQEIKPRKSIKYLQDIVQTDIKFDKKFENFPLVKKTNYYSLQNYTNYNSENHVYDINGFGPTLTASGALNRIKILFPKQGIRYLSSLECFRYMTFKDSDYQKIKRFDLVLENKIKFLCGNSIVVNVLEDIFREFKF